MIKQKIVDAIIEVDDKYCSGNCQYYLIDHCRLFNSYLEADEYYLRCDECLEEGM
jgi:hypothetical protein